MRECTNCEVGKYADATGSAGCTACAAGTAANVGGSTTCTTCIAGSIAALAGAVTCEECAEGTIAATDGLAACANCPAGKTSAMVGSSECTSCLAGKYAAVEASRECTPATGGYYVDTDGATAQKECLAGKYSSEEDCAEGLCTECSDCLDYNPEGLPEGQFHYYQNEPAQAQCKRCACDGAPADAVSKCDTTSGVCTCDNFYFDSGGKPDGDPLNKCDEQQSVSQAMWLSYSFLAVFLFLVLPFIFCTGGLAVLAGVWRKDVAIAVYTLRQRTHMAIKMRNRRDLSNLRCETEKRVRSAFNKIDRDFSGAIGEGEMKELFRDPRLNLPEEATTTALSAVDLNDNGAIEAENFHQLISFVAPLVREQETLKRHERIFEMLDENGSGTIDADELREASRILGISLDHVADRMGATDTLASDAFIKNIKEVLNDTVRESAAKARVTKEGYIYATYERLRLARRGVFTIGCLHKALEALGHSLRPQERFDLLDLVVLSSDAKGDQDYLEAGQKKGCPCATSSSTSTIYMDTEEGQTRHITYREYRIILSAAVLHHECGFFPMSRYREAFLSFVHGGQEAVEQGYMSMDCLADLLFAVGHELEEGDVETLKADLDRGNGILLFDDFVEVMERFVDSKSEDKITWMLLNKGRLLRMELATKLLSSAKFLIMALGLMLFMLFTMLVDVYLMAQSFEADNLKQRVRSYLAAMRNVFDALRPLPLYHLVPPLNLGFKLVKFFTLEIDIPAGVTCEGMQAPMYLSLNFLVISTLVVFFDSSIFLFLRLSPEHFHLPASGVLVRLGVSPESARKVEELFIKGFFVGAGRNMKMILQLVMAKMLWNDFFPRWDRMSKACEQQVAYSEKVAIWATTGLFWLMFIPMIHLLLNTAVYGMASKKIDKMYGTKLGILNEFAAYHFNPESKAAIVQMIQGKDTAPADIWHRIHSARIADDYRASTDSTSAGFKFYRFRISGFQRYCSLAKCFFKSWVKEVEVDEVEDNELQLFDHDPRFWQQPWSYMSYFINDQSDGSIYRGIAKYFSTLGWKLVQLTKLTLGYWDNSLISNMQIKSRSAKLTLDQLNGHTDHEEMIANVGLLHALIWQVLPYCVFVGKAGEALNASPIAVFDDTAKYTVQTAMRLDQRKSDSEAKVLAVIENESEDKESNVLTTFVGAVQGGDSNAADLTVAEVDPDDVSGDSSGVHIGNADIGGSSTEFAVIDVAEPKKMTALSEEDENFDVYRRFGFRSRKSTKREDATTCDPEQQVFSITHNDIQERMSKWPVQNMDSDGEEEAYFQVQVHPPRGVDSVEGEGMLIWFEPGSNVDFEDKSRNHKGQAPSIVIYREFDGNIISHGHRLNGEEVRHFRSERMMEQRVVYGKRLAGVPGKNLPSAEEPLFIPALCCVVEFSTPGGTGAHFILNACYTGETPISFDKSWNRRFFRWICNILQYLCELAFCVLRDPSLQMAAFAVICFLIVIRGIDAALDQTEEQVAKKRKHKGTQSLMFNREAWCELFGNITAYCARVVCSPKKKSEVIENTADEIEMLDDPELDRPMTMAARRRRAIKKRQDRLAERERRRVEREITMRLSAIAATEKRERLEAERARLEAERERREAEELPVTVNPQAVQQLMDMGFSEDTVTAALVANRNDIEQEMNALLTMDETAALQAAQGATGRQEVIRVTAPVGSSAGTLLRVVHKGQQYNVSVPAGVPPGAQFFMTVPAAGGAAATAKMSGGPVSL